MVYNKNKILLTIQNKVKIIKKNIFLIKEIKIKGEKLKNDFPIVFWY